MAYVLGIDSSTTATKAVLIDEAGTVVAIGVSEYGYDVPQPLWSEQDPSLWWNGTIEAIRSALTSSGVAGSEVAAVGLTGQMHGAVLLDADDRVLRPAILWNDQRTAQACEEIREAVGAQRLIEITGNDALTGFTAPKLVWVRDHEPEVWARIAHVLLPKDYVRLRLTGEHALDKADGAGTLLFDLAARDWSLEVLDGAPDRSGLAAADVRGAGGHRSCDPRGGGRDRPREGTPVVAGGGDQSANGVGVGAVSVGDGGPVARDVRCRVRDDRPAHDDPRGQVHAFCHAVPGKWHLMTVMLSAAGSLRWFRDTLAPGEDFGELAGSAGDVQAGSDGLLFLPYLTGERSPHADPLARGAFVGLTVGHDRRHLTRAVLEGVAFGLRDGLDQMIAAGMPAPGQVRASGGGTASPVWRQILADVLQAELATVSTSEGAAYGAGLLAAVGAGWFPTVEDATAALVSATVVATPGPDVARYTDVHAIYRDLYPALAPSFHRL